MKKRTSDPWIPAAAYGALLPAFSVNLVVSDLDASVQFYRSVFLAHVHYADPDFAAIKINGQELMLHADHTYERSRWSDSLRNGTDRGVGAELRILGMNPDELLERATEFDAVFKEVSERGHGWREAMVQDPDGYVWAVGEIIDDYSSD